MRRIESHAVGVDQGSVVLFSDFQNGGEMWTGTGPRELRRAVRFTDGFAAPPAVHVSISMWDTDGATNQRVDLSADEIGREGFTLVFRTWADSRIARVRADWMAIGPVAHPDDWSVD
ncbi:H-type lectin domain-containing protein [Frigidibacter sp. MR17.14]|uniref:H-type lectin domain-containing protein n=1 Tax=Frigidibacter sp. MR17.14 TaxID=3126509 RepID=UPI003012A8A7